MRRVVAEHVLDAVDVAGRYRLKWCIFGYLFVVVAVVVQVVKWCVVLLGVMVIGVGKLLEVDCVVLLVGRKQRR